MLALAVAAPGALQASNVSLTAADSVGTSSFNTAGKWSNGQAPSSANDYFTSAYFLRTPADTGSGNSYTFAGHSLTLQQPTSSGVRSVIVKSVNGDIFTINNLTNAFGGILENGGSGNVTVTFTGNLYTIAGNSAVYADQGPLVIGYPLAGATGVILTNGGGNATGISYTGNNSAFQGILYLTTLSLGNGGGNTTVNLNGPNSQPGNPATFTPNQIWISGGCTLEDSAGLTFNNSNGGITLAGNATISATTGGTVIAEPITDNGSNYTLTIAGGGEVTLSTPSTYGGGTTISAGTLKIGVANALTNNGAVTDNGTLDLNGINTTIDSLSGSGVVDTTAAGSPTLTIGANGGSGTFSGTIQNSVGALSLTKTGAGVETFSGGYFPSGTLAVAAGSLSMATAAGVSGTPASMVVTNGAVLSLDVSSGNTLAVNNLTLGNSTINISYGTVTANPAFPAITASGGISAPGSSIVINLAATGLQPGTFTLIKYTGTALSSIANIQVSPPPGVAGTLVNNTANHSLDLQITSIPNVLTWNGLHGGSWDLTTPNWALPSGAITVFQQYTNNGVVAGDAVTFDDTLTNDFVDPQPTNITLNATFYAFPVVFNSTLPYRIAGTGGIAGPTSLAISNSGSVTMLTSNKFTGGVIVAGATLIITNDSALGISSNSVVLNSATLELAGPVTNSRAISMPVVSTIGVATNVTATLGGVISGGGASFNKSDNGTLVLTGRETVTGDIFLHGGFTTIASGGSFTNGSYDDVGQNGNDAATLTMTGTGALSTTSDFNLGDLDNSTGTLNMSGSATLVMNAFFIGSANASGSTASGVVNQSGGTITEISTGVGEFCIGGRTSVSGVGTYNISGGTLTANAGIRVGSTGVGVLNQSGGSINAMQGINIARIAGSFGTNNLNGGVLATYNVASSTGTNAIFNFNGGTLLAAFNPPTPWFSGLQSAFILAGGAIIDSSNYSVTITQPLLAGSANGGLTKKGTGTLTLSGVNTFTGPITNLAGTLALNSASTYAGGASVNAGTLQLTPSSILQGPTMISNNAVLSLVQSGSSDFTMGNLTFNGAASGQGGALALTPATANNPAVPMVTCGTLTLNGTNTISLAAANVGTLALIQYTGTAGSGNCTNLVLPQGGSGYISNNAASSTLYAVVTSTGPGLVWTGTNTTALNTWNINATTNWLVSGVPTSYHQIIVPGDAVTFNDSGSPTVLVNTNVAPAGLVISNNVAIYTFSGSGAISGPASLQKMGTGSAILDLTNDTYAGNTIINGGTLQLGIGSALPATGNLVVNTNGTINLAGFAVTAGELTGAGYVDNSGGNNAILTVGSSSGGTWTGTITNTGGGGLGLHKNGAGTWVVGGKNYLNDGQSFTDVNQMNQGTTILTNGGLLELNYLQCQIGTVAGQSAEVMVAGGALVVTNNVLSVGYGTNSIGTLVVNSGTVDHSGYGASTFAAVANSIDVGAQGSTGTLIVNGGQVLNDQPLYLGDGVPSSGILQLNGGVVQASEVLPNGTPTASVIDFDGGTLQAATNTTDFIEATCMVLGNGAVLDDGGYSVSVEVPFQPGDSLNGGLVKTGAGTIYLDQISTYTGTTVVTNGTLAGVGGVSGPLVVGPAGNLEAGDAGGIGYFTLESTPLTLHGNTTLRISKTGGSITYDQISGASSTTFGGVLTVTNITSDATPLAAGDTFQLFGSGGTGNFTSIVGSPGTNLAYQFTPATGVLSVVVNTVPNNPYPIGFSVSGNTLKLAWPNDPGWILQSQTNSAGVGLGANWVDVAGSSSVTNSSITINPANPTVFFRLRHP